MHVGFSIAGRSLTGGSVRWSSSSATQPPAVKGRFVLLPSPTAVTNVETNPNRKVTAEAATGLFLCETSPLPAWKKPPPRHDDRKKENTHQRLFEMSLIVRYSLMACLFHKVGYTILERFSSKLRVCSRPAGLRKNLSVETAVFLRHFSWNTSTHTQGPLVFNFILFSDN